ncbi:MAG: hypothetical protein V1728_01875 [Candidatus Micrarchaeota archaeon]
MRPIGSRRSGRLSGQATIEYILVLAMSIIIVLIGIGLYSYLVDSGQELQNSQLRLYWSQQARPFIIDDSLYETSNHRFYLAISSLADEELNISGIMLNNTPLSFYQYDSTLPDDLGPLSCTSADCTSTPCACSARIRPGAAVSLVTQGYLSPEELCGSNGQGGKLMLLITYDRPNDLDVNYTQTSLAPLPFACT